MTDVSRAPIFLLDDDPLIRMAWEYAANKKDINLTVHSTYEELLSALESVSKEAAVYIDNNLGIQKTGLEICEELYKKGYKNLTLATGEEFLIEDYEFLVGIIGKTPPF